MAGATLEPRGARRYVLMQGGAGAEAKSGAIAPQSAKIFRKYTGPPCGRPIKCFQKRKKVLFWSG
ncbi:hypothetical protein A3J43_03915 [Candidatus Uhrbacteria bacterium RIFCSPHIGHO2_12_FULL_54_23]|uniref:Uncharacterized protein n=1 Tax=Candidatus Uhrbacteria bacterium RIFCSPHIGHO2_12_FULL_54_23 TaxID=1802397 RepID=A0A1F7UJN8_9BACT|nr:MAG: hypothetical protein A3J43_03915 [Candidatus Uhrbacteria bacterium RIFCSPHIGHO2_12_FULL_54_23]